MKTCAVSFRLRIGYELGGGLRAPLINAMNLGKRYQAAGEANLKTPRGGQQSPQDQQDGGRLSEKGGHRLTVAAR